MSVLDQLRALEQQVQRRLREPRPLVDEYRDLEKVAERLGLKREGPDRPPPPRARRPQPTPGLSLGAAASRRKAEVTGSYTQKLWIGLKRKPAYLLG